MKRQSPSIFRRSIAPVLIGGAMLVGIPTAGMAVSSAVFAPFTDVAARFTPAGVDPALADRVNTRYAAARKAMRFTPASGKSPADRTVTVAVRVDGKNSRAVSVRSAIEIAEQAPGKRDVTIAPTRFDLGLARGFQSFAKPATALPKGVSRIAMQDLSEFRRGAGAAKDKPSRFQPRIALEADRDIGRAPRTLEGAREQSVDVGGSYRVTGNLDVTAGVRLSQERNRLRPLTNGVEDDQAVYVGTQLRF